MPSVLCNSCLVPISTNRSMEILIQTPTLLRFTTITLDNAACSETFPFSLLPEYGMETDCRSPGSDSSSIFAIEFDMKPIAHQALLMRNSMATYSGSSGSVSLSIIGIDHQAIITAGAHLLLHQTLRPHFHHMIIHQYCFASRVIHHYLLPNPGFLW